MTAARLIRALEASARDAGCPVIVRSEAQCPWSSATYVGTRHRLRVNGNSTEAVIGWLANLREELTVPGHVVAEIAGSPCGRIEALVLDG